MAGASLAIVIAACGGSMTADEYVEELNALAAVGRSNFEAAAAVYNQSADPTLADEIAFLQQEVEIRRVFLDGFEALDPPGSIAEVHQLLGDAFIRLTTAAEDLAASADPSTASKKQNRRQSSRSTGPPTLMVPESVSRFRQGLMTSPPLVRRSPASHGSPA